MRLVLVAPRFGEGLEGGTERVVRAQARLVAAAGHDVLVVAGSDAAHAGRDVEHVEVDGLEVARLPRRADERYDLLQDCIGNLGNQRGRNVSAIHFLEGRDNFPC